MNTSFSISSILSSSWSLYKQRPFFYIGLQLVPLGIVGVFNFVTSFITNPSGGSEQTVSALLIGLMSLFLQLISWALMIFMNAGVTVANIEAVDNKHPTLSTIFHQKKHFISYGIAIVIMGAVGFAGFIFFIIPSIIWAVVSMFTLYILVDKSVGPIHAMSQSIEMTKGIRLKLFMFLVVTGMINIFGAMVFIIGLLVTLPVTTIAFAKLYAELRDRTAQPMISEVVETS